MLPSRINSAVQASSRPHVLGIIKSPLGFFGLALLIVESFLLGAGVAFGLPLEWKLIAIGVGVLLFLIVVGAVLWLAVKHPTSLVFSEISHVRLAELTYGDDEHPPTQGSAQLLSPPKSNPQTSVQPFKLSKGQD